MDNKTIDLERLTNRIRMAQKDVREAEDEIIAAIRVLWDALPQIRDQDGEYYINAPCRNDYDGEIVCDFETI